MPTESQFKAYVEVQKSGMFNMLMEAKDAAEAAGLDINDYFNVIKNYSKCAEIYK